MNELDRIRWQEIVKTVKCAAFCVAIVLFVFVGLFTISGCQSYQPPGDGIWRAL
jgi:hypothetical protein